MLMAYLESIAVLPQSDNQGVGVQVRSEATAAAQEKLETTRRALDTRREELRGLERQARAAAPCLTGRDAVCTFERRRC